MLRERTLFCESSFNQEVGVILVTHVDNRGSILKTGRQVKSLREHTISKAAIVFLQ